MPQIMQLKVSRTDVGPAFRARPVFRTNDFRCTVAIVADAWCVLPTKTPFKIRCIKTIKRICNKKKVIKQYLDHISSMDSQSNYDKSYTGNTVTLATPVLNLNLARQHGDKLIAQKGPPPPTFSFSTWQYHPPRPNIAVSQPTTIGTTLPL